MLPPPAPFALTDASSLLWRMDLLGVETGAVRWRGVAEVREYLRRLHPRQDSDGLSRERTELDRQVSRLAVYVTSEGGWGGENDLRLL